VIPIAGQRSDARVLADAVDAHKTIEPSAGSPLPFG
jgi:hypothetical protein